MTFSILGCCPISGQSGIAIATSSIAIGARCPFVRAGVGAASTQNVTDPRLGPALLDQMEAGKDPKVALTNLVAAGEHIEHRQLLAINLYGETAHFTGAKALGRSAVVEGVSCVAGGNLLANETVPMAMVDGFGANQGNQLADKLLAGLLAGLVAGGEEGDVYSAALLVASDREWPIVNLRVDWCEDDPVLELMELWQRYLPQVDDYLIRALNPNAAPNYGVPGDE